MPRLRAIPETGSSLHKKNHNNVRSINNDQTMLLKLNKKDFLQLARTSTVWDILAINNWDKTLLKKQFKNSVDIQLICDFIIRKIKTELWQNPEDLKNQSINIVINKITKSLNKSPEDSDTTLAKVIDWIKDAIAKLTDRKNNYDNTLEIKKLKSENRLLKQQNSTDWLTWLLNRATLDLNISDAIEETKRGSNVWVAMIDIDNFKSVNDTYWHLVWDIVIKEIAKILKKNFRAVDKVARYWWEEFCIVLKGWNIHEYKNKLDSIVKEIELTLSKKVNSSAEFKWNNKIKKPITISVWISTIKWKDSKVEALARADKLLYKAKEGWKNRVNIK